jgi:hypothetical protein
MRLRQPWMLAGREKAAQFWTSFATKLQEVGVSVDRLHLDIEPLARIGRGYSYIPGAIDGQFYDYSYVDLGLTDAFSKYDAYLLYALSREDQGHKPVLVNGSWQLEATSSTFPKASNRWENVPVPGFGTQTMKNLWDQVSGSFNSREHPLMPTGPSINYNPIIPTSFATSQPNGTSAFANHATFIWYAQICQTALAAAHTTTAVNTMKNAFPSLKGGNYEMMTMTPGVQDFGWYQPIPGSGTSPANFARVGERGYKDSGDHGFRNTPLTQGPGYDWLNYHQLERVGDFSSPPLYAVGRNNSATLPPGWLQYRQNNPYLPGYPLDDRWTASMRWHRWTLESIISSEGERAVEQPWNTIAPWIVPPGMNAAIFSDKFGPNESDTNFYYATDDDINRQLALLRSKAIPELLIFNPRPDPDRYADFEKLYRQVYDPQITLFQIRDNGVEAGTTPNCGGSNPPPNCPDARIERVVDTNPRFTGTAAPFTAVPHTFDLSITRIPDDTVCPPPTGCPSGQTKTKDLPTRVQMKAQLGSSASAVPLNERLRLNLELDAILTVPPTVTMASVNPVILVKFEVFPDSGPAFFLEFTPEPINGVAWGPNDLPLHAPTEDLSPTQRRWTMRRTFDIEMPRDCPKKILRSDGSIEMYITVRALARNANNGELWDGFPVGSSLEVRHDLVQPIRAYGFTTCNGGGTIGGGFGGGEQGPMNLGVAGENVGANIDGSGGADVHDLTMFLNGLAEGNSIADVNNDEQIDGDDVEQFMTDYTDPQ